MEEIWKDVKGYEGRYQVSNTGEVRSLISPNTHKRKSPKILKQKLERSGYYSIGLWKDNKVKRFSVHRLLAIAFVENPDNKKFVNHIDGIKTNNYTSNVEWVTRRENTKHAIDKGLVTYKGEGNYNSKLTRNDVLDIRNAYKLGCFSQGEIAKSYNVSKNQINLIVNNKSWCHL